MEDFVGGVVGADDPDEDNRPTREVDLLPRPARNLRPIEDHLPVLLVQADFNVVRVSSFVAIPQQKPGKESDNTYDVCKLFVRYLSHVSRI